MANEGMKYPAGGIPMHKMMATEESEGNCAPTDSGKSKGDAKKEEKKSEKKPSKNF
jgi:hypothetical protein